MKVGETITIDGREVHVISHLGEGNQAPVYKVEVGDNTFALKWYHTRRSDKDQREHIKNLADRDAPSDRFLWPILFLEKGDRFGYLMDLCPPDFISVGELLNDSVPLSHQDLIRSCLQLVTEFRALHNKGLCYGDISYNNIFLNPNTGDIRILDNDNVLVNNSKKPGVLGTPKFMAPEIVRGDDVPSKKTDDFSLAVLLFYMLVLEHPLHGKQEYEIHAMDIPAMDYLHGKDPVFIFDPDDDSNRPVPGYNENAIKYWQIYPKYLRAVFTKTFTDGLDDPNQRTSNLRWQDTLLRLHDNILYCPRCGNSNFYDLEHVRATGGKIGECWHDGETLPPPPRMKFDGEERVTILNENTQIFDFHVDPDLSTQDHRFRFDNPIAEVNEHPSKDIWGLKNLSSQEWRIHTSSGTTKTVPEGRSVTLSSGLQIDFGRRSATIRG